MDISEFLASMQTNPGDRALARNTRMAIPDADNDPQTQDAAPAAPEQQGIPDGQQQEMADDDQSFAGGGEVEDESGREYAAADRSGDKRLPDRWDNIPASENIEDRRGEDTTGDGNQSKVYETALDGQSNAMATAGMSKTRFPKWQGVLQKGVASYAEGGEVPDEEPADGEPPLPPEQPPAAAGAIPEPDAPPAPKGARQVLGDAMGMRGRQAQQDTQDQGAEGWRTAAMEGINKAIDWGYNTIHGVNRGIGGGENDPEHKASYVSMEKGHGAMSPQQWDDLMQSVDPSGLMDPATKQMKAIGELYTYYGGQSPEKGAAAVWAAMQKSRIDYNKARALTTVAVEKGNPVAAAAGAQHALNLVPDGNFTRVTPFRPGSILDRMLGSGTKPAAAQQQGIPEDTGAGNRIGMGDQASEMDPNSHMQGPSAPAGEPPAFKVVQTDPESGKVVAQHVLTNEQMIHMMAQPFDKSLAQGTVNHAGEASLTPAGQGGHMSFGQRLAQANGLPAGMDVGGLQTSEIAGLRRQYLNRQVQGEDPRLAVAREANQSRIEAARISAGSRENNNQRTNEGSERRENIRAGNDPSTGAPRPDSNLTGKGAARDSNMETQAQKAAKNAFDNKPVTDKRTYDEFLDAARKKYNVAAVRPGATSQPAPAPAPAPQAGQPQTKEYNGRTYTFDPVKKGWIAQ